MPPKSSICHIAMNPSTDSLLQRFWEIEEISRSSTVLTHDEQVAIDNFSHTHVYAAGRYIVTLPRKPDVTKLGNSRAQALQRFHANERSLIRKGIWESFQQVVQEYLDLGHAQLVPMPALQLPPEYSYYMPMHGVVKESSSTTKLRVVFDASAKTTSGISLNDTLMVGPTLYPNITDILLRFRTYPVAVSSDISKMYRAVELCETDRDFHRFLWRPDKTSPVKDYQMSRVTFGVASSPYVAIQSLQQTAHDFGDSFQLAKPHVFSSMYVDDCLAGADTPQAAIELYKQLRQLLLKGGFDLRKWRSSCKEVLDAIDPSMHDPAPIKTLSDSNMVQHAKALGMVWDSTEDLLYVSVGGDTNSHCSTKREIISSIAKTFDVLGWMAPAIVIMKVLFQHLWELKLNWDKEIPPELQRKHQQLKSQLPLLKDKAFSRCYFRASSVKKSVQLHGFLDATENAYAAVVYLRATYSDGPPTVVLVASKTKVAPLKRLSIPRLELCGAQLLAKLLHSIRLALGIDIDNVFVWCDSTIVLYWLDGSPRRFKTFVGNRVFNILSLFPSSAWNHVPTSSNPADCASRGLFPQELLNFDLWWSGPTWLQIDPIDWPFPPVVSQSSTSEDKNVCTVVPNSSKWIEDQFSSYDQLLRINAWIRRFIFNLKAKGLQKSLNLDASLSVVEIHSSETHVFSLAQNRHFNDEFSRLYHDKPLKSHSRLISLNPFVGKDGLLRVGGRLSNSSLSFDQKHPPILPKNDVLTTLFVSCLHVSLYHCGPSLLLNFVGAKVHIIGARRLIRDVCRKCVTCRRSTARAEKQQMRQLPSARVNPSPPFTNTGMEFAGPFLLKKGHTRKPVIVKAYLCIFVCFSTKATHLECVSDLSMEAYMAAFKRFIARCGLPLEVYSDNGYNFKGAHNDLKELYKFLLANSTKDSIHHYLLNHRIKWNFSPERAPHFGGLWEAAVKSAKMHLRRIIGQQILNFEEFSTLLCQVESCLNSRPLLPLSSLPDDAIEVLTPGHFLIGRLLLSLPEANLREVRSPLKRWMLVNDIKLK